MVIGIVVGLLTGILSGFGIGGGSLLMLYLTAFAGINQFTAAGINLLYFIVCAPPALASHIKNNMIDKKAILLCGIAGSVTAVFGSLLAAGTDVSILKRCFGFLLLYIGIKELFYKKKSEKQSGAEADFKA